MSQNRAYTIGTIATGLIVLLMAISARAEVRRVVAMAPNAAEIICGLGAGGQLVGVSSFCTYPPELADVPKVGGLQDPNLETIIALRPDLIVLRSHGEAGHPLRQLAADRDIRIYDDNVETLEDLYKTIGDLGELLGRGEQAAEMIRRIRDELADVKRSFEGRRRVRVLFTLRSPTGLANLFTIGRDTYVHQLLEMAGGENIFGGHTTRYPNISLEEVVGRNPEVIIESMPGENINDRRRAELLEQWSGFERIDAVRHGRIFFVTEEYLTIPSQRITLAARKLAELLHPEAQSGE